MENNVVSVMLWGEEVGKLYWDERNKRAVFNYHPDFIKKGVEIAPLTASVKGPAAKGMPILGNRERFIKVFHRSWQIHCLTGGVTWSSTNGRHKTISPSANSRR